MRVRSAPHQEFLAQARLFRRQVRSGPSERVRKRSDDADTVALPFAQQLLREGLEGKSFVADGIEPHGAARAGNTVCDLDERIQRFLIGAVAGKARGKLLHLGDLAFQRLTMGEQKSLDLLSRRDS
jgi:hypothetical protein